MLEYYKMLKVGDRVAYKCWNLKEGKRSDMYFFWEWGQVLKIDIVFESLIVFVSFDYGRRSWVKKDELYCITTLCA